MFASGLADNFQPFGTYECDAALWFMMDHPILAPNPGPGQSYAGKMNLVTISFPPAGCGATDRSVNYYCCVGYTPLSELLGTFDKFGITWYYRSVDV